MPRPMHLITALLILAMALPASATLTRVRSMGGGLNYLEDDAGATVWYAPLLDYPDQVVLDIGDLDHDAPGSFNKSLTSTAGSGHFQLDEAGKWGTLGLYVQENLPADAPGGAITLLGARGFGKITLGLKASFSSYFDGANSSEEQGWGESLYFHAFGLGVRWDVSDKVYGDIAGEIVNVQGDATLEGSWSVPAQQTWTTWGARTRWFIGVSETVALVPVLDHRQDDRQVYSDNIGAPADQHALQSSTGLGVNIMNDPDNLIVVSGEFTWGSKEHTRLMDNSSTWDYDYGDLSWKEAHARVGLESRVLPWLTLRGGLQYTRNQQENVQERGESIPGEPDRWAEAQTIKVSTPITLGVGLHVGSFMADLVLNARWSETYGTIPFAPSPTTTGTYTGFTLGYHF